MPPSGTSLLALCGVPVRAKITLATTLLHALHAAGRQVLLLDNGDVPVPPAELPPLVTRARLTGGCVCCTLAGRLIPQIARTPSDTALLISSARAEPALLAHLLGTLQHPQRRIASVALLDEQTCTRHPHLADQYRLYADLLLLPPYAPEPVLAWLGLDARGHGEGKLRRAQRAGARRRVSGVRGWGIPHPRLLAGDQSPAREPKPAEAGCPLPDEPVLTGLRADP